MHSPFDIEQFRFLIESSDECCIACVTAYVGESHPGPMLGHSFSPPLPPFISSSRGENNSVAKFRVHSLTEGYSDDDWL